MQDHLLRVGEELVIEGICVTILAIEEGRIFLGIGAAEPCNVRGPVVRQRRPQRTAVLVQALPSDN